jgi:deoxyribonuclease-4
MVKLGSRKDRHQHVGEGEIGKAGMKRIVKHPKLRELPFIMETPKKGPKDDLMNIGVTRGFYN